MRAAYGLNSDLAEQFFSEDEEARELLSLYEQCAYYSFEPRINRPELNDEQTAFVNSKSKFTVCLGGTGSGKTEAAGYKTSKYVLETPAPRRDCPFWIIGETFEQTCSVCWDEKLSRYIPPHLIKKFVWHQGARNWPRAVILKDIHNTKTNWVIEFKSYEQGRDNFQGRSIGGYWFNEEVPLPIVEEVQGRCREYDSPGWADFTPVEIRSPEWPERYNDPPEGWEFFHLNSELNHHLADGWFQRWIKTVPEDMRDTRTIGKFTTFRGMVFKEFNRKVHIIPPFEIPKDWQHRRGIDFGYANPFACVWVARDHDGCYYVYDLHYASEQTLLYHATKIKERYWDSSSPYYGTTYSDHQAQERREMQVHGINTTPAKKDLKAGIELIRSLLLQNKLKFFGSKEFTACDTLISEMLKYHWPEATGSEQRMRNPADAPVDFFNHAIDALRYVVYSEECGQTTFTDPVKTKPRVWQQDAGRFFS